MKRMLNVNWWLAVAGAVALSGCASTNSTATAQAPVPKFSHPRDITNPYLPLGLLKQDILENKSERVERTAGNRQLRNMLVVLTGNCHHL